ncbi:hypothetical protein CAEBREN_11345 [Caenorhabditis brenneri]|uniref:TIL domain-containing protein n=1 Tax=Caenorhabditis brenneri TaxID=135651 RepID=G0PEY0_CAEBE|nr:hypothetical protein CAEBREN_11345 [Caenorhabditis brenneri]
MHRMILLSLLFLFGVSCQLTYPNISLPLCPKGQVRLSNKTCVNISDTPMYPGTCPFICMEPMVCINNKCQDPNNVNMCGAGLTEQDGKCVPLFVIGFKNVTRSPDVCPHDCLNGCKDGRCAPITMCKPGGKLVNGFCIPNVSRPKRRPTCTKPCPNGSKCEYGVCRSVVIQKDSEICITSMDCPAGTSCFLGKCVGSNSRTPKSFSSCPKGKTWYGGKCITRTNCPKNCPPGSYCSRGSGVCKEMQSDEKPSTCPGPCPRETKCENGECVSKMFPRPCVGGKCKKDVSTKVRAPCVFNAIPCVEGQTCVRGQCVKEN